MSKTKIVRKIVSKDEKAHKKKGYLHAHRLGDAAEIEHFGKSQFDLINKAARKLPKGHWIGTHTERHNIHISQEFLDLIPKQKQKSVIAEIRLHEKVEDRIMRKKR